MSVVVLCEEEGSQHQADFTARWRGWQTRHRQYYYYFEVASYCTTSLVHRSVCYHHAAERASEATMMAERGATMHDDSACVAALLVLPY